MEWDNFWQLLAGLGIFLFGMSELEASLKELAGRSFKLFLKKHTANPLSAILSGALVTALLQSSSVVTLMVLGFVGSGVLSMRNALAVVLGSNLGTTLGSWVVGGLGFRLNAESFSFPIIAVSILVLVVVNRKKNIYQTAKFFLGFGFLFLGLGFMKASMEDLIQQFDFTSYQHLNRIGFVVSGFIITAIIQSGSATMVIALSALNAHVISFDAAVSVVIGSGLGTSIKSVLDSFNGMAAKRRVAIGNLLFNFTITILAFLFTFPLIKLVTTVVGVQDPLISLVFFQSIINLAGIFLFFPFLPQFENFLEKYFKERERSSTYFIQDASTAVPDATMELMEREVLLFILRAVHLNSEAFRLIDIIPLLEKEEMQNITGSNNHLINYNEKYEEVKRAEGEILSLYMRLNEEKIKAEEFVRLNQLISSVKNAMYSAKGIKDISQDRKELRESGIDDKYAQYQFLQTQLRDFYLRIIELMRIKDQSIRFEELVKLMRQNDKDYEERTNKIYKECVDNTIDKFDISTLLNVSREVYSSCKAIVRSMKDFLLDEKHAEDFDNISVQKS